MFIKQATTEEIKKGIQFVNKIAFLFLPGNAMFPSKRYYSKGIVHVHKSKSVSNKKLKKIALAYNPLLEVLAKRKIQKIFLIAPYFRLTWEKAICGDLTKCANLYKRYTRNHIKKCNAIVLRQLKKQCILQGLDFKVIDIDEQEPILLGNTTVCSNRSKMYKILDCDQVHFRGPAYCRLSIFLRSQAKQALNRKC